MLQPTMFRSITAVADAAAKVVVAVVATTTMAAVAVAAIDVELVHGI